MTEEFLTPTEFRELVSSVSREKLEEVFHEYFADLVFNARKPGENIWTLSETQKEIINSAVEMLKE